MLTYINKLYLLSIFFFLKVALCNGDCGTDQCCETKEVGGVIYYLKYSQDTSQYGCTSNCIYTKHGEDQLYCFRPGDKKSKCLGLEAYPIQPYEALYAGIGGTGIGPVLPPWPCIKHNLDCRNEDGSNILNITTVTPWIWPIIQDSQCNDFCRQTPGCEFWTIALSNATIEPPIINCFALSSCAEIEIPWARSAPKECLCPEYKGGCPFCPWDRPHCFGYCSSTEQKCIGECVPVSSSNDEVCTDLQAKAQYGDCADDCHEESDGCKQCVADATSSFNCGGKYASCGIIDLGVCGIAIGKAFLECKNAGSALEILKCIAEKVASNSACRNCFCKAVCKFLPSEFCNLCQFNEDFSFKTALPPIRIFAEPDLTLMSP